MKPIELSVVSPVYCTEALIAKLVGQVRQALAGCVETYEIILVDDGSPDGSWDAISAVCRDHPEVIGLKLSRNFGQHYAISAGLSHSRGERVVVMDCDLQDRPAEIPKLLAKALEGYDVVLARRWLRRDGLLKRFGSWLFYRLLEYLTGTEQDPAIANFGVYHGKVIKAINAMPETIRYFPTMVRWVGFRTTKLDVEHAARSEGKSSYSFGKLFNLASDICLAYSDKPLRIVVKIGFVVSCIGFLFATLVLYKAIRGQIEVLGYASLMVSIWILAGLTIMITGIVGLYVGKSFEGVKRRPAFIVDECLNAGKRHAGA